VFFYWLIKNVLGGPIVRLLYRPRAQGAGNVPTEGPVILAANHLSFLDSIFIPLFLNRPVIFLGKSEYFERRRTAWFFRLVGVIPVKRESGTAAEAALRAGLEVLKDGGIIGIYPEGTRSPDGRVYRGKTGVARLALAGSAPVVPVVVFGTRDLQPPNRRLPKLSGRVRVAYGEPLTFEKYAGRESDKYALRRVTDEIMFEIMMLSGQEYVDEYAARAKKRLDAEGGSVSEGSDAAGGGAAPSEPKAPAAQDDAIPDTGPPDDGRRR